MEKRYGVEAGENLVLDGMLGLAVGDALGVPYEFRWREELQQTPAVGMIGYGTYNQPEGSWSIRPWRFARRTACAGALTRRT